MAATVPELELDPRWFTVLATSPNAVLTKHNTSGSLTIWRLEWRERGDFPAGMEAEAWANYMKQTT